MQKVFKLLILVIAVSIGLLIDTLGRQVSRHGGAAKRPNFVFILTDDQDLHMDSLSYMPNLEKHITIQGTTLTRHYCTVALCCPSRVSLWTGKAAHNTNVTDVNPPYGGYPKFIAQGFNDDYFPLWLQSLKYNTYYVGKLFNAQTVSNYASPPAAGWNGSEFLLDPYTYRYLNASFTRNAGKPISYEGQYVTDLIKQKSFGFLDDAVAEKRQTDRPFFLTIAPIAPHSNVHIGANLIDGNFTEHTNFQSPPVPAERHKHLFADVKVPRTPHFNPDTAQGVSWISRLPQQNQTNIDSNDHFYRQRLRSLQAVDEMIDELMARLEQAGVLDETYIFYSTDNGYHIGQHRLQPGKQGAFEEDVHIPMMVRGPGVPKNSSTDLVTAHTDLAPTFLALAGGLADSSPEMGKLWASFDGAAIPLLSLPTLSSSSSSRSLDDDSADWRTEHVGIEMWGIIQSEGKYGATLHANHTYKAVRVVGRAGEYNLLYTVWCSGEHELYDLVRDPWEMENLFLRNHSTTTVAFESREEGMHSSGHCSDALPPGSSAPSFVALLREQQLVFGSPRSLDAVALQHLIPRLDTLMQVLRICKGWECTHPWQVLHPDGKVKSLRDALDERYDEFYEKKQERVKFERCEKGYILESEGPVGVRPYLEGIGG